MINKKRVLTILVENLQEKKQEETDSKFFTQMPSQFYIEVTQLLLKWFETKF